MDIQTTHNIPGLSVTLDYYLLTKECVTCDHMQLLIAATTLLEHCDSIDILTPGTWGL